MLRWNFVSDRIIKARSESCFKRNVYYYGLCTHQHIRKKDKNSFYAQLQSALDKIPNRDMLILMGDINAKVGSNNTNRERKMGRQGIGEMNENEEMLADFCFTNSLVIRGTIFSHRKCHKATWVKLTENRIDLVMVRKRYRSSLQDVRVRRGADVGSDPHLLVTKIKMQLSVRKNRLKQKKSSMSKNLNKDTRQTFQISSHDRFEVLQSSEAEKVEQRWLTFKEAVAGACEDVLEWAHFRRKMWISDESCKKVERRRLAKQDMNQAKTRQQKQQASGRHSALSKKVKKKLWADKQMYSKTFADEAEEVASKGDLKTLYATTRILSGGYCNPNRPVRNKKGRLLTTVKDQLAKWKEYFQKILNQPASKQRPQINSGNPLSINIGEIIKEEIHKALSSLKSGKAAGTNNILAEALKEEEKGIINYLHQCSIWYGQQKRYQQSGAKNYWWNFPNTVTFFNVGNGEKLHCCTSPAVLTKIILERIKDAIDNVLRDEQAGFRKERFCADQIATLRVIVEQSIKCQSLLYMCYIDFKKTFDSVDKESI